ncbi:adenylate/guanylate cyclase domain-containing protein [Rhizobium sp. TH2]|uniref:adenylate/guanylate cyclase domain-containing protein n=1 Tax=Rhizobium sp. TH2 TaxID=2775403 RepID=UPI002156FAC3|nr:adenylate/guanylate cyclase domain-containing protein [Rhizobium sp. TH2]UVC06864.1 adenylate/guanylate cyclase domain-containing protein [Rhizobium sp. TH2]
MSIHSTDADVVRLPNSAPAPNSANPVRLRVIGSELLRLVAVAVLMGNFVLGSYTRTPTHTILIIVYLVFTLVSLFLTVRRPDISWRLPLFVLVDAIAVLIMLYMHAAQGPFDHSHALTPAGLVVAFILLNNAALSSNTKLVAWFSGIVFAGWLAVLVVAGASSGLVLAEALLDPDFHRELGLALSFGAAALAVYVIVRETADTRDKAAIAQRGRSNLARFFSPTVVEQLADGDDMRLERRRIAVMFVDLRGFTSFAESASSEQMRHMLSEFRDIVSDVVVRHGGAVDKYLGDGVMAVFGHPAPREDDADRALACALELVQALEQWREREGAAGRPALKAGIGLHAGTALAGVLEAGCHSEYTVLGDVVNVAQRLQAVSKSVGATLVVSAELRHATHSPGLVASWREAKQVDIPGRKLPLDIAYV